MSASAPAALTVEHAPALVVRTHADARDLAPALLEAAEQTLPLSSASIQTWWDQAPLAERTVLVLRLAQALPHAEGLAATRLADPGWRHSAGLPLALATFAVAMRLKRLHRAENTLRAWRSDWRTWRAWCKRNARPSFNPSAAQLSAFFVEFAPTHKVATIRRLGSTLTAMHKAAGFPDPLNQPLHAEIWRDALTSPATKMRKAEGKKKRKRKTPSPAVDRRDEPVDQAEGLRRDMLDPVIAAIDTSTLIGARDAALLCTTYDLLGRRSEVVALTVNDVAPDRFDASGTALIRRSKTDQTGEGRTLFLRADTLARLERWKEMAKITEGPIFRALKGFAGRGKAVDLPPLDAAEVARILRRRVATVMKNADGSPADTVKLFSGHSCRVGAAQDMAENGATDIEIMLAGRWTSLAMVAKYTAKIRAKQSGMARLAAKQDATAAKAATAAPRTEAPVSYDDASAPREQESGTGPRSRTTAVEVRYVIERGSKFLRGKKQAVWMIEGRIRAYPHRKTPRGDYVIDIAHQNDEDLHRAVGELIDEIYHHADFGNCIAEVNASIEGTERYWDDYRRCFFPAASSVAPDNCTADAERLTMPTTLPNDA